MNLLYPEFFASLNVKSVGRSLVDSLGGDKKLPFVLGMPRWIIRFVGCEGFVFL